MITGEVDRTTPFEQGFPMHEAWRDDRWEPDPLILDDQAMIVKVAGKGLVVISGCGHAGNRSTPAGTRAAADRRRRPARGDGRLPSQRAALRTDHR
ncbi:MAG: hypothetical protein U5R31_07255 [Acidimicrobiia bacterium]|nr:hypothetical protein [Acidimicrobiia bacterium]